MQFEEHALRLNTGDFASRSKAKAKPQRRDSASSPTIITLIGKRTWTNLEPGEYTMDVYERVKEIDPSSSASWKSTPRQIR